LIGYNFNLTVERNQVLSCNSFCLP